MPFGYGSQAATPPASQANTPPATPVNTPPASQPNTPAYVKRYGTNIKRFNPDDIIFDPEFITKAKDPLTYYTQLSLLDNNQYMENVLREDGFIDNINLSLVKYNISISYNKKNSLLGVLSDKPISLGVGISTLAFIPAMNSTASVVSMTLESDKIGWGLENPYLNPYDIDDVEIDEFKNLYIVEMEHLDDGKSKEQLTHIREINKVIKNDYLDKGRTRVDEMVKMLLDTDDLLGDELEEQFEILLTYLKTLDDEMLYQIKLDLHSGNFTTNTDGKLVLLDPIFNPYRLARKRSNKVTLDRAKLSTK